MRDTAVAMRMIVEAVGGLLAIGALLIVKFGATEDVLAWFDQTEEPQRYMSSNNPWSKDYVEPARSAPVHFRNCSEAKAQGFTNIPIGAPGYRGDLDGDGDGFACEPYP